MVGKKEGINRETASRIVSWSDAPQMVADYRLRMMSRIPIADSNFDETLYSSNETLRWAATMNLLERSGVLPKSGLEMVTPSEDHAQRRLLMLGRIMDMMLKKNARYGIPLPPEMVQLAKEAGIQGPSSDTSASLQAATATPNVERRPPEARPKEDNFSA